jgi:hypothetical protein
MKIPRGFGLRQLSAAFSPQHWPCKAAEKIQGLPQFKTLARHPAAHAVSAATEF